MEEPGYYNKKKATPRQLWLKYRFAIICYFALAVVGLLVFHLLSDGDFSFLMTLGSVFVLFSLTLLCAKVALTRSAAGISLKTLQCYAVVYAARLCSILVYEGYLPFDRSGDWFYQAIEVLALLMVVGLVVIVAGPLRSTYSQREDRLIDTLYGIPKGASALALILPALLLAILLHPSLNGNWFTDVAWAWSLYLEAIAILPQLMMFFRQRDRSTGAGAQAMDMYTANFVFCVAVARALHFVFWMSSYHELNDKYAQHFGARYPGYLVVLSQIVNLLLMGDFVYVYIMNAKGGRDDILPLAI